MRARLLVLGVVLAWSVPTGSGAQTSPNPELAGLALSGTSVQSGDPLAVVGAMTVAPQPMTTLWTDGVLDFGINNYPADPNADLIEGSVQHALPGDPLTLRVKMAPVPVDTPPKPYQWHRWSFQLEERWYFVEFTYLPNGAALEWRGSWYYCKLALGSNCIHGTTPPFPVTWDPAARTLTGRIPMADLAAVQPDGLLRQDAMRHFNDQYVPEAGYKNAAIIGIDRSVPMTSYDLPIETVSLAVARVGEEAVDAGYATLEPGGDALTFEVAGQVSTTGLEPGDHFLFVKGCFGPCTVQALPFTVA